MASTSTQPKKRRADNDDPYEWDADVTSSAEPSLSAKRAKKTASQSKTQSSAGPSVSMDTIEEEPASISEERFNVFKKSLTQLFRESRAQSIPMARFRDYLTEQHKANPFRNHEMTAAFERMTDANQIMVADDIIFLI